jgi:hypothetical protein
VVSTQGRSLWILDDLTPLHQITDEVAAANVWLYRPRDTYRTIADGYYAEGGPGENPPTGVQVHYVLKDAVSDDVPMAMEILDAAGRVVFAERSDDPTPDCPALPRQASLERGAGAHRWSWDMQVGSFPCFVEITATSPGLGAYTARPGRYQVRLTAGDASRTQDFEILVDPRLDGIVADPVAEYAELDSIARSLYDAVTRMGEGVTDLRLVQDQLDVIMDLTSDADVQAGGATLGGRLDGWIERILQKELKTYQHAYQFEARLLMKYKDLLERMSGANIPLTQGVRDAATDYLAAWAELEADLQVVKRRDIPAFNEVLERAGLPTLYLPRPIS